MAVIQIPSREEAERDFVAEVALVLAEVRRLRAMLDAWSLPAPPPSPPVRAPVIPIDRGRS